MISTRNIAVILLFVVLLQLFSIFLTNEIVISQQRIETFEPFGNETVEQAGLNTTFLLIPIIIFTIGFVVVIRIFGMKIFRYIIVAFTVFLAFMFNYFYTSTILNNHTFLNSSYIDTISLSSSIVLSVVIIYSTLKHKIRLLLISAFIVLAELGSYLSWVFVPPTLYVVIVAFAIYDIFAVFFGPLKYFVKELGLPTKADKTMPKGRLKKIKSRINLGILTSYIGGMVMGSGDLIFYSLIVSSAFLFEGVGKALLVLLLINMGIAINYILLNKFRRVLPGLPIPIFLAIIPFFI